MQWLIWFHACGSTLTPEVVGKCDSRFGIEWIFPGLGKKGHGYESHLLWNGAP